MEEALGRYEAFAGEVAGLSGATTGQLAGLIGELRGLDESVACALEGDGGDIAEWHGRYWEARDSILASLGKLVDTKQRSLMDVLDLATGLGGSGGPDNAGPPRERASGLPGWAVDPPGADPLDAGDTARLYLDTILAAERAGMGTGRDLLGFLHEEEREFLSVLTHLPEGTEPLLRIIEDVPGRIRSMAKGLIEGPSALSMEEIDTILGMRQNRRLIQVATRCVFHAWRGENGAGAGDTSRCYQLLLCPWTRMDARSMALLTDGERSQMRFLADETPSCVQAMAGGRMDGWELPALIMKSAIMRM